MRMERNRRVSKYTPPVSPDPSQADLKMPTANTDAAKTVSKKAGANDSTAKAISKKPAANAAPAKAVTQRSAANAVAAKAVTKTPAANAAPAKTVSRKSTPKPKPKTSQPVQKRSSGSNQVQGFRPENNPEQQVKPSSHSVRGRVLYVVVLIALLGVFLYASYQVAAYLVQTRQAKQEEEMIHTMIADSATETPPEETSVPSPTPPEATAAPSPTPTLGYVNSRAAIPDAPAMKDTTSRPAKPEVLIQFNNALAINPDTVGQLQMGESINTYVVQRDNSYYLRRSFTGEYSFSGAIFLDVTCSIYPRSRNLIIHGHNMHNGTAFGKLSRYDDVAYLNKYPHIEFSTLYDSGLYTPFAVVYYSIDRNLTSIWISTRLIRCRIRNFRIMSARFN